MGERDEDLGREFFEEIEEYEADEDVKEYVEYEERMYVPLVSMKTTKRSRKIEKSKVEKSKVEKSKIEKGEVDKSRIEGNVTGSEESLSSDSDPWRFEEHPIESDKPEPWWSERFLTHYGEGRRRPDPWRKSHRRWRTGWEPTGVREHFKIDIAARVMERDEDLGREFFEGIEEIEVDEELQEYVEYEEHMKVSIMGFRRTAKSPKIEKGEVDKSRIEGSVIGLDESLSSASDPWWFKEGLTKPGPKDPKPSPETLPIEYDPWWSEEHPTDSGPTAPGMSLTKSPENLPIESDPWWSKEYLTESDPQGAKPTLTKEEALPWWSFLNDEPWWSEKFLTDFDESPASGIDPGRRVRRKRRKGWERKWERTHFRAAVASGVMGEKDEDLGREFFEEIEEFEVPEDLKQYVEDEEHVRVSIMSFRKTRRSLNIDDDEEEIEKKEIENNKIEKRDIEESKIEKGEANKVEIDKSEVEQNVVEVDDIEDDFEAYEIEEDGFEGNFEPYELKTSLRRTSLTTILMRTTTRTRNSRTRSLRTTMSTMSTSAM
jgi:hypothetical protein